MNEILAGVVGGLAEFDARLRAEQAVHGVDALPEVALHAVLAQALSAAGFGVIREALYPGEHAAPVRRSARNRCDLVLLPEPGMTLRDPAAEQAALLAGEQTLFAPVTHALEPAPAGVPPGDACWIEVKAVAQHAFVDGVPGPNRAYADQLVRGATADLVKLARDSSIWTGAAAVVLFCESEAVARHDLAAVGHRLLDADLPMASPEVGGTPIDDRVGNAWCGLGIYPLRAGG